MTKKSHIFHRECIKTWVFQQNKQEPTCPFCRKTIPYDIVHQTFDDEFDEEQYRLNHDPIKIIIRSFQALFS